MKITRISSIGRPIDVNYPTNRAILIWTLVVAVAGATVQVLAGEGWVSGGLWGVNAGLAVFLAWAMCRELDPDHPLSAFVAASLATAGLLPAVGRVSYPPPQLLVILWLLVAVRVVNRTTGLPATVLDSLGLLGLGTWLSYQGNWGYGALTVIALLLDGQLPDSQRRQRVFAGIEAVVVAVIALLGDTPWGNGGTAVWPGLLAVGISALFAPVLIAARSVEGVGDETGQRLSGVRVQAGQGIALLAGIQAALWSGEAGLVAMLPLWAAVVGASIYWLFSKAKGASS